MLVRISTPVRRRSQTSSAQHALLLFKRTNWSHLLLGSFFVTSLQGCCSAGAINTHHGLHVSHVSGFTADCLRAGKQQSQPQQQFCASERPVGEPDCRGGWTSPHLPLNRQQHPTARHRRGSGPWRAHHCDGTQRGARPALSVCYFQSANCLSVGLIKSFTLPTHQFGVLYGSDSDHGFWEASPTKLVEHLLRYLTRGLKWWAWTEEDGCQYINVSCVTALHSGCSAFLSYGIWLLCCLFDTPRHWLALHFCFIFHYADVLDIIYSLINVLIIYNVHVASSFEPSMRNTWKTTSDRFSEW